MRSGIYQSFSLFYDEARSQADCFEIYSEQMEKTDERRVLISDGFSEKIEDDIKTIYKK